MAIHFSKMQGIGNDFVVIDATLTPLELSADHARRIADRHYGIGCDQILIVEPPRSEDVLFHYRIFNADGSEVEQCGNGARCFARFVFDKGLTDQRCIPVSTASGKITLNVETDGQVRVNMGVPRLQPKQIAFVADTFQPVYTIEAGGQALELGAVSMGNPHAVLLVDNVDTADIEGLGPLLEHHPRFPQRANIGFMEVINAGHMRLRVFERGAGETLACGTGACAAMVSGRLRGLLEEQVMVDLPGGRLNIRWAGESQAVEMTGPAEFVFEGTMEL